MSVPIAERTAATFDEVFGNPDRSSSLSTGVTFLLNAGMGMDYRFPIRQRVHGGARGLTLGVEGGYMLAPGKNLWHLDGITSASGGPNLGIEGFYVWFSLGAWGRGGMQRP